MFENVSAFIILLDVTGQKGFSNAEKGLQKQLFRDYLT
jgi:hypothetical protein